MIKKDYFCNINKILTDDNGRYIICEIQTDPEKDPICLCCLYAPNKDSPTFFETISEKLADFCEQKIIIGDFNLVLNTKIDRVGSNFNHWRAHAKLCLLMEEYYLSDIWRDRNPEEKRFSWRRTKSNQYSRIDLALISKGFSDLISNCTYIASIFTDHSAVYLSVNLDKNERGRGYWKFNNSLIDDDDTRSAIADRLKVLCDSMQEDNATQKWLYVKSGIKKYCQELSRKVASEEKQIIANLSEKLSDYEDNLPLDRVQTEIYENTKLDLEEAMLKRARKLIFRSKVRWYEMGEKNSKYFYNLEKARYNARTCQKLITEEGEVSDDPGILHEQWKYYSKLYSKDTEVHFDIRNTHGVYINDSNIQMCQEPLTLHELHTAVKNMKSSKTPGEDGLSAEFYKEYWNILGPVLHRMVCESYDCEELVSPITTGILNLIPKGGKDSRLLKNLRPITLLNVDYKIIEKALAARLDRVLQDIIHSDQKGFLAGRRIASNIRRIFDLMQYCSSSEVEGILLNLDFEKCFDNIDFTAIIGSLQFFHIPEYIQTWVKILYKNFRIKVQNNGKFTDYIAVERSVHQGGCISVQLFLLCAEVVALEMRQCEHIQGIPVNDITYLLNQYADDMSVSSLYNNDSLQAIFRQLELFRRNAGFKVNYDKTEIYRLGSLHGTNAKLYTQNEIKWTDQPISVLGVTVGYGENIVKQNYSNIIHKARATLHTWSNRHLSLIGKINIVNTLVGSLLVYRMTVLPNMPKEVLTELNCAISEFIWNGRRAKIPLKILQGSKRTGGLNLVNLQKREMALKISWIHVLQADINASNLAYYFISQELKATIWMCNLKPEDMRFTHNRECNQFWYDVLYAWCCVNYTSNVEVASRVIWLNSLIRIENKPVLWKRCIEKGLIYVHQLYGETGLISVEAASPFGLTAMQLFALHSAIPKVWRKETTGTQTTKYEQLKDKRNVANIVYKELTDVKNVIMDRSQLWRNELDQPPETYVLAIKRINAITNVPKLRAFQYRLLMKGLVLNTHLFKWGYRDDNLCTMCEMQKETYLHLFFECRETKQLLTKVKEFCENICGQIAINELTVIWNCVHNSPKHVSNLIVLITKQYIYAQRCKRKSLNFNELLRRIKLTESIEKYIAQKNNCIVTHHKKWFNMNVEREDAGQFTSIQNVNEFIYSYLTEPCEN